MVNLTPPLPPLMISGLWNRVPKAAQVSMIGMTVRPDLEVIQ
jgi:hypothetical protein